MSITPSRRGAALQPAFRQRFRGGLRRETRGNPEKIPLGGPSRTEAEHPQPRLGQVGFTNLLSM